jgi:hypothetical protein
MRVGFMTGGIPSSSLARVHARGGRGRTLHEGEATRTPGREGEPAGRRRREEMAAASFTGREFRCPPYRQSPLTCSPGTSPPLPVRHHSPSLSLPTLEQTNLAGRCIAAWSVENRVFAAVRYDLAADVCIFSKFTAGLL